MEQFEERRWTSADGLSLFARDYPAATNGGRLPVVCLHGLTRNASDFEDLAPLVASGGRRVLALDIRGRGRSEWDSKPQRYTPQTYVGDVLGLLDALALESAVFIGTSMGGIITMALAAARPAAVASAVLNDVGPVVAPEGIARIKSYAGGTSDIANWDDARDYVRGINGAVFPKFETKDWDRFARRVFVEKRGVPVLNYDPAIALQLRADHYAAAEEEAWRLFRDLASNRPTLLIRGARSDLLSPDTADRMKRMAPKMRFAEVPYVGHAPTLSEPEAVQAIQAFLAEIP
jgi:pimeloyl-ACP methyl ester carboxylesterase